VKRLNHGMYLDSKRVMDNALPTLERIKELVPLKLHQELDEIFSMFEDDLVACDISDRICND